MLIIRFFTLLGLYFFSGTSVLFADTCTTLTGDPANELETKIDSDCQNLIIRGSNNNVIIGENNPSVVIQSSNGGTPDYDWKKAVITTNSQDTTIINYGNIGKNNTNLKSFAIWHDTGSGSIKLLDNRGNIKANDHTAINNRSNIDTINNSGMIYTHKKNGIVNGSGGEIKKIINSGTIEARLDWAIKNVSGGNIDEITNTTTGTIKAKRDKAIRNYGSDSIITTITNDGLITSTESTIENESPSGQTGALISNIINNGTIQQLNSGNGKTIKNKNATIDTINNSGTIRAVGARADYAIYNVSYGKINNIINSGTIKVNDNVTIKNGRLASIGIIDNSGTIHASDNAAVFNEGQLNQIINSGAISAGDDDGIKNDGTIDYISNTGTISAGNNIGIYNSGGTITTLDNSQSNLTYKGALPTNYNAIINSPSDYGKVVFSGVSGATNFGVHSSSTLAVGTYGAVMSGLNANNIASGTSGKHSNPFACSDVNGTTATFTTDCADLDISGNNSNVTINSGVTISGEGDLDWELDNSSEKLWDLVVTDELHEIENTGYNNAISNLGVIAALENSSNGINNQGSFETLINNGAISSNDSHAINNETSAVITTLTNTGVISSVNNTSINNIGAISSLTNMGTISAGGDNGIKNTGTINYISNTGTISAGNNIGIYNSGGTITTLDNSQSNLTYKGALPTNYNAIINSPSDYGKVVFSGVSGATNFGVHSSSTLAVGTYGAVMSGLNANNIASGTSGTFVSGADRINWTLENINSTWNLIIADKIDITPDTEESIKTSVKPNTIDSFNDLNSVIEVNFANMNTYDCDSFGKKNGCISLGGRNTHINNPRTRANGIVLTAGYKFSDSLRVAGFYHRNYEHNTPKRFKLSDKTPLLGTIIVWNQYSNGLGLQIKLATAFQQKYATLIREIVGSSEEGRAKTEIGTKSRVIEFQQGYRFNDDIILHPYLAFRKATSKQDAYSEVGILSPLSFNEIKDEMITALLGLKFDIKKFGNLPDELTFKGSLGIEHDLSHSVSKIEPSGISGLTAVSLTESFNSTRPVASFGFDYEIKSNQRFSGITQFQELPYENKDETNYYLYFTQGF